VTFLEHLKKVLRVSHKRQPNKPLTQMHLHNIISLAERNYKDEHNVDEVDEVEILMPKDLLNF